MQETSSSLERTIADAGRAGELESRVAVLEREIAQIQDRNARVTVEKAWEQSLVRVVWILLLTYATSAGIFYLMGADHYMLNALVPTLAFLLSMQSLPFVKLRWLRHHESHRTNTRLKPPENS
jgi:hypothetical protein